jgi:hypothetical protein
MGGVSHEKTTRQDADTRKPFNIIAERLLSRKLINEGIDIQVWCWHQKLIKCELVVGWYE